MTVDSFIRPGVYLSPVPTPLRGTLLDVATTVTDGVRDRMLDATGLYESFNCLTTDAVPTMPCPANTMAAPVQSAAGTATTGGTLAAGTYLSVVTAINSRGETVKSNEISRVTTGATSTITFNWAAVTGATGYRVYVTAVGGGTGTETLLTQVGAVTTYVWTGTPARGTAVPPTTNTAIVNVNKTFNGSSWQDGFVFAVYSGLICKAVGWDVENAGRELERVFTNKESVAVARAIMSVRFVAGSTWSAATDLTPAGGAVDPAIGLAILEGHAGSHYAGVPTIHAPRTIGSLLTRNGQVTYSGNMLMSQLGSKIAADSGYESPSNGPTGAAPSAGELWMYASGEVTVASGEAIQKGGMDLVETADSNRVRLLRERMYVASVDCYTAAVRVKVN